MSEELAARLEKGIESAWATRREVEELCRAAREEGYRAVCVPSGRVADAYHFVEGSRVKVCSMIGLPFGTADADAKRYEVEVAADSGAHELEFVPSLGRLREREYQSVLREIRDAVAAADERPVKVVVEVHLWPAEELREILQTVLDSGAQYITTGFLSRPTAGLVRSLREMIGPRFGMKASGLTDWADARELLEAGADLVGTVPFTQGL